MHMLIRFSTLGAGLALATVVVAGPATALAGEETGPDSHACKEAKEDVKHLKWKLERLLEDEPRKSDVKDIWDEKNAWAEKVREVKDKLEKAIWEKVDSCKDQDKDGKDKDGKDDDEKASDEADEVKIEESDDSEEYSQVGDVPSGAVDTGGGPA